MLLVSRPPLDADTAVHKTSSSSPRISRLFRMSVSKKEPILASQASHHSLISEGGDALMHRTMSLQVPASSQNKTSPSHSRSPSDATAHVEHIYVVLRAVGSGQDALREGDCIVSVGGAPTKHVLPDKFPELLQGPPGTDVSLAVRYVGL